MHDSQEALFICLDMTRGAGKVLGLFKLANRSCLELFCKICGPFGSVMRYVQIGLAARRYPHASNVFIVAC